jgi:tripartite-type tricarboxylate transporter receptor subunit TctC
MLSAQALVARWLLAAAMQLVAAAAIAQTYPARQITLVVPFAPGGPADFLGRLVGQKMSEDLGQQIVVDNRPGANTIIAAQAVAKATPDGYTLLMAIDGTLVMNPFLYSKLAYDPFKDFAPISLLALVPSALVGKHQPTGKFNSRAGRTGKGQSGQVSDWHQHPDFAGQCGSA